MERLRRLSPCLTWIALLAVLAMAWLPTVSRALTHAGGGATAWVEVCTAQGMRLVAVPVDEPAPGQAAVHLEHCPLCTLAQDQLALPRCAVHALRWPPELKPPRPELQATPRQAAAAHPALPRGPPAQG